MTYYTPGTTSPLGEESIKDSMPESKVTASSVKSYAAAELSLKVEGPVSPTDLAIRKALCLSCEHLYVDKEKDEIGFCKACGCGFRKRAALTVKLKMPKSTCPKDKWKPVKGRHRGFLKRLASKILSIDVDEETNG